MCGKKATTTRRGLAVGSQPLVHTYTTWQRTRGYRLEDTVLKSDLALCPNTGIELDNSHVILADAH